MGDPHRRPIVVLGRASFVGTDRPCDPHGGDGCTVRAAGRCAKVRRMDIDPTLLAVIIPIIVVQLGLLIWGLYDLTRPERKVKGDSKILWALVMVLINIIGPIVYFLFGREEA
jgi:hypothetical protein